FTTTATFESEDEAYKWITQWLERHPNYSTSRDFEVAAKPRSIAGADSQTKAKSRDPQSLATYFPAHGMFFYVYAGSTIVDLCTNRHIPLASLENPATSGLTKSNQYRFYTLRGNDYPHSPLKRLIEQAGAEYRNRDLTGITIYIADQYGNWKRLTSKPHRNYGSVVLEPQIKEKLFGDVKEFLDGKQWYAQRGIPYRRGYLLFGTPGSGKTSSIHALASELGLDIYIVPLSMKAIHDGILSDLITSMPQRCILLYEDIDAAFSSRTSGHSLDARGDMVEKSGITLSGLLNTIDGVQAQEGCLLFATSNHPDHLDPALIRPGRMDVKIEYSHATQWQAEQLFCLFYPERSKEEKSSIESMAKLFAEAIPPSRLSVAQLQGYLMRYKDRHEDAAQGVKDWVEAELNVAT
ncbi:hypothetical protein FRC07_014767, partial [Ceratobasidium sp. 392]